MATAREIVKDALTEINALSVGEEPSAPDGQLALLRLQNQIDAWGADFLTITVNTRTLFTLTSGTSTVTIGQSGTADIAVTRPTWFTAINYVVPASTPSVEVPLGQMDDDSYANLSIKALSSALPTQFYYNETFPDGELFFWPVVSQNVQIALYYPDPLGTPATLDSVLVGPPGWQEAFMYQLALRLVTPFGKAIPELLPGNAVTAFARIKRPNTIPGLLGIDQGLVPTYGGAYNIVTDQTSGSSNR